jgi:hypothetical protein
LRIQKVVLVAQPVDFLEYGISYINRMLIG